MDHLVESISRNASVEPDTVRMVLSQLGIERTLEKIESTFGKDAVSSLTVGDLSISARMAGLLIAR